MLDKLTKEHDRLERVNNRLLRSRAVVKPHKPTVPDLDSVLEGPCTQSEGIVRAQIETLDLKFASNEESTKGDSAPNSITNRLGTHRTTKLRGHSPKDPDSEGAIVRTRPRLEQFENTNPESGGVVGESNPTQAFYDYFTNKRK